MASPSEIILPIGTQKHDPAWKHCLMIRSGDRTVLKCKYCLKQFLGGGIHRIKEHLARQKGNASCCVKVPPEVQSAMLQSLESAQARKKRRVKIAEEMVMITSMDSRELDGQARLSDVGIGAGMGDMSFVQMEVPDEGTKSRRGRKRKRPKLEADVPQDNVSLAVAPVEDAIAIIKPGSSMSMDKDQVYGAIGKFLYDVGILEAVNSVYFQPMLDAITAAAGGTSLGDFSYHEFRGQVLERTLEEVKSHVAFSRSSWGDTGCSLLADEWVGENGRTMINFLVYCPKGTVFLKSVDATHIVTSSDTLYELLRHVVEEVGDRNVVQVVTKNSEIHALAGKKLAEAFPTLFWSPCAFQCIDGMLEDIGKLETISEVLENAKTITRFIYNSAFALNLVRTFTRGKDLIACAETHNALNFATLKTMHGFKEELRAAVRSNEWSGSSLSKKPGGMTVSNIINSLTFWSNCALVVRIAEPLVRLHKLVCSAKRPAMGYIYVGLYQAKETIRKLLVDKNQYMPYWEIIDWRWNKELARPLHAAGFFLNPLFFEAIKADVSNEIFSGMLDCIERLVPDLKKQDKIQEELNIYRSEAAANFRRPMAVRTRRTLIPG